VIELGSIEGVAATRFVSSGVAAAPAEDPVNWISPPTRRHPPPSRRPGPFSW
jgi:hypothetical protein